MTPTVDTIIAEIAALASKCAGAGIAYMGSPASESFAKVCDELREIQSNLAALPAPGEWLPIESAPKDGSFMWLGDPLNIRLAFWNLSQQRWVDLRKIEAREAVIGLHFEPTHWHAMPRPPLAAAQGEK